MMNTGQIAWTGIGMIDPEENFEMHQKFCDSNGFELEYFAREHLERLHACCLSWPFNWLRR